MIRFLFFILVFECFSFILKQKQQDVLAGLLVIFLFFLLHFSSGWDSDLHEELGITYYLSQDQSSLLPSSHTLTVKDLLISNFEQKVRPANNS